MSKAPSILRVALYARVSTSTRRRREDRTVEYLQDPEMQLREMRSHVEARGWRIEAEHVDRISGAKDRRPGLDLLMSQARAREIDAVMVWRFDRFARSTSHLLKALEEFDALGAQFISLREQVDTTTPAGRLLFTVLGAVAEMERCMIQERVRAGIEHARAKGKTLGRRKKVVDVELARMLMDEDGLTLADTARKMGVARATLQRKLKGDTQ